QLFCRFHGIPLAFRHDANEIIAAHYARTRYPADRCFIDVQHPCAGAIPALPSRPHDAPMQHAGHSYLLHVDVLAADLRGNVISWNPRAHKFVLSDGLYRRGTADGKVETLVTDQLAVGYRPARISFDEHDS